MYNKKHMSKNKPYGDLIQKNLKTRWLEPQRFLFYNNAYV